MVTEEQNRFAAHVCTSYIIAMALLDKEYQLSLGKYDPEFQEVGQDHMCPPAVTPLTF